MRLPDTSCLFDAVPWAVVDLESDGVNPNEAMPCEVAVARFEHGELVGSWSAFVNPGREMSAEVIGVHGITNEMVATAHPAVSIAALLLEPMPRELFEDAWPVGYNGQGYDRTILRRLALAGGAVIPWLDVPWIDPLVVVRDVDRFVAGTGRHRLGVTCARHKVEHVDAHRAFGDCAATGRLLWKLRDRIGALTLEQLLKRQAKRSEQQERDFAAWLARQPKREGQPA